MSRLRGEDRGAVTLWVIMSVPMFVLLAGLAYDSAAKRDAAAEAFAVADEAARAGAGLPDPQALFEGRNTIDPIAAITAADAYLQGPGREGNAYLEGDATLKVVVTVRRPTMFLSLIGINEVEATSTATADLLIGIRTPNQE